MKLLLIITTLCCSLSAIAKTKITISAAISLKEAFREMVKEFEKVNPQYSINLNLAGSGQLRQQIEAGAPVDIFASASLKHIQLLEKKKLISSKDIVSIARNKLVLTSSINSKIHEIDLNNLKDIDFKRFSIGKPLSVPAGSYAKEVLQNISTWDHIKDKVIYADNVRQVFGYVSNQEVELGIVYYTDFLAHQNKVKAIAFIPDNLHAPISYPMSLVSNSSNKEFYTKWKKFVLSEKGKAILTKNGFK